MTTDIERQFFDMFGIEKQPVYSGSQLYNPFITGYEYPQITDRILLELICILNTIDSYSYSSANTRELKEEILFNCIEFYQEIGTQQDINTLKQQVQALFEENNNDR